MSVQPAPRSSRLWFHVAGVAFAYVVGLTTAVMLSHAPAAEPAAASQAHAAAPALTPS